MIEKAFFAISSVVVVVMMILISADAFCRYVFNMPILGVIEVTQDFLMEAVIFLTISTGYKYGIHVRVTLFIDHFPQRMQGAIHTFDHVVSLAFAILLTTGGWDLFMKGISYGAFSMGVLQYPMAPSYVLVPVGGLMLCLRILYSLFFPTPTSDETENELPAV